MTYFKISNIVKIDSTMKIEDAEDVDSMKVNWNLEVEDIMVGKPGFLEYDYGLTGNEISILDFLPGSVISTDVKLEELKTSSTLELEREVKGVKVEKTESCAAALAIEANIPTPEPFQVSKWRTFISAAYYHPNILAHADVDCLKELFQLLGSDIEFESVNVMIDLGKTVQEYKPVPYLRKMEPLSQNSPIFTFAHVKDFFVDMELKVCIVKKYGLFDSIKKAVAEMVNFIIDYPEALYLETYGFVLDFLLKFGVDSDIVIDAVMRTQRRRIKCQYPASVLILKKANRLGKGRKEYLQMRLLESPEQKYRPIVPIISEPPPVRQLRNRRTGCIDGDRTPKTTSAEPISHNTYSPIQMITGGMDLLNSVQSSNTSLIFAVKRKLFVDDNSRKNHEIKKDSAPGTHSNLLSGDSRNVNRAISHFPIPRKKRFYKRRDSNTIEKPFICSICPDRSFAYKGNLVLHMKKKHSTSTGKTRVKRQENIIPAFSCPVCVQGYASKYRCRTHMQRHHPEHEDWDPISNEDALRQLQKATAVSKNKKKCKKRMVRRTTTTSKPVVPLSETQISSLYENPSQLHSAPNFFASSHFTQKKELNSISVEFDELRYATLNHVRTRQQFRAALVQ